MIEMIHPQNQAPRSGQYSPKIELKGLMFVSWELPMEYAVEAQKLLGLKLEGSVG